MDGDEKVMKVLKRYGEEVTRGGGSLKVVNKRKPSFEVRFVGEKEVKVSPIFGPDVIPSEWFNIAEKEAQVIKKAILKVL